MLLSCCVVVCEPDTEYSKPFVRRRAPVHSDVLADDEPRVEGDRPAAPGQVLHGKTCAPPPSTSSAWGGQAAGGFRTGEGCPGGARRGLLQSRDGMCIRAAGRLCVLEVGESGSFVSAPCSDADTVLTSEMRLCRFHGSLPLLTDVSLSPWVTKVVSLQLIRLVLRQSFEVLKRDGWEERSVNY